MVYYARLSGASKKTLALQGGPMSPAEVRAFESDPLLRNILQLRRWDECAKTPGAVTAPLEDYRPLILAVLDAHPDR